MTTSFLQLFSPVGPSSRDILAKWSRSDICFNSEGENIKSYIGELSEPEGVDPSELENQPSLEMLLDDVKPTDMSQDESSQIKHLLRCILQYDASKRPSASEPP